MINIGQRIRYFREKLKMTQSKVAELANMDANNISRIERGESTPNIETMIKLCNSFDITPNELLLFEYNVPKNILDAEIADLLHDCSQEEYKKIIEYIHFTKQQR